jgi:hypothetical protein
MNNANKVLLLAGIGLIGCSLALVAFILLKSQPAPVAVPQKILHPLPVEIAFEKAASGKGSVAQVKNISDKPLPITLRLVKSASGERKYFNLVVGAGKTEELGTAKGYAASPGDALNVGSPGYDKMELTVP